MLGVYNAGQQLGLAPAAELIGLDLSDIVQHRALQDSMLSMSIFKNLYYPDKFKKYVETSKDLHYRLTFKSYYLTDINDPLVNKNEFNFTCDKCGEKMKAVNNWALRNKTFTATLYCKKCKQKMTGKVKFKINYNGMSIKKKLVPFDEPSEKSDK